MVEELDFQQVSPTSKIVLEGISELVEFVGFVLYFAPKVLTFAFKN